MVNICNSEQHVVLMRILDARNRPSITPDMPLWKLKLTEEEYTNLKETLVQNAYRLEDFGIEAALCYAEWWRRDYKWRNSFQRRCCSRIRTASLLLGATI